MTLAVIGGVVLVVERLVRVRVRVNQARAIFVQPKKSRAWERG